MKQFVFWSATLILPAVFGLSLAPAQLTENFDTAFTLAPPMLDGPVTETGWIGALRSDTLGDTGIYNDWIGGPPLGALNGAFSLLAMNFRNSNLAATDTTSSWMMSPEMTMNNGDTFSFFAISANSAFSDRLLIRMSTAGASTDVGVAATDVGDFGTVLLDINPNWEQDVFLREWTQYEATVTGLSGPTQGRIAFHYFNPSMDVNGDIVQIDSVEFATADEVLVGDVNCDGQIDLLDVGPFVDAISTGVFSVKADINTDGVVDLLDVGPFVTLLSGG